MDSAIVQELFYENRNLIEKEIEMRTKDLISSGLFYYSERDDIAQELRIEIFKSLKRYDSKKSKLSTYIGKVTKRKGIDLIRYKKAKRRLSISENTSLEEILDKIELGKLQSLSEFFIFNNRAEEILSGMDSLMSEQSKFLRQIYELLLDDCNVSEIAKILRKNRRTIYKSIDKIRNLLR